MSPALPTEPLELDDAGQPFSRRYGDRYASRDGALGQARHVFLGGNELPLRWAGRRHFVILETGFGLGTNFLAAWQAWRADAQRPQRLHFVSLERHPLRQEDMRLFASEHAPCAHPPELRAMAAELAARWPLPLPGLHRLEFDDGAVVLTLGLGDAAEIVRQLACGVDAFFLDGFSPDRNPQMWTEDLMRSLARLARTHATAASYTCARPVRDALAACGFEVQLRDGFGSKRQMLHAVYRPRWKMRRHEPPEAYSGERTAIVVGAGLAGCASAYALRRRGWNVTVLESAAEPAAGASGLPAGLLQPLLSIDDNLVSRLTRAGFFFSRALLQGLQERPERANIEPRLWAACGVYCQAAEGEDEDQLRACVEPHAWPQEYAVYCDPASVAARIGFAPGKPGIWFAGAGVVAMERWCRALLGTDPGTGLGSAQEQNIFGFTVARIEHTGGQWHALDDGGRRVSAAVLVLANAHDLPRLVPMRGLALQDLAGRVSLLRDSAVRDSFGRQTLADLRAGVSGDGYVMPPLLGQAAVGATYEEAGTMDAPQMTLEAAHESNLLRLQRLLARPPAVEVSGVFQGRRCVAPDRLPLAGALVDEEAALAGQHRLQGAHLADLPRRPGLFCATAMGSRGLALAPLLGEHVAALINGEPPPIEVGLAAAVDPGRFLLRQLRTTTPHAPLSPAGRETG